MKNSILSLAVATLGLVAVAATNPTPKADVYKVSAEKSTFKWIGKKVTGEHYGAVKFSTGTINVEKNAVTGGEFSVDMTSIDVQDLTGEWKGKLEGHLKSEDFFSVEKHTKSTLKLKTLTAIKGAKPGENNYTVVADLTIKGITSEVTFPAFILVKKDEVVTNAEFAIDRTKYDIKYGSGKFFEGLGDKTIDDTFTVKVRVVATK